MSDAVGMKWSGHKKVPLIWLAFQYCALLIASIRLGTSQILSETDIIGL
jgi:hypothetical protein